MGSIIAALASPDVPIMAGVPAILGAVSGTVASGSQFASLLSAQAQAAGVSLLGQMYDELIGYRWGLFDDTLLPIFPGAVVLQIAAGVKSTIANAPLEGGSFVSYNKVDTPRRVQIGLSFQGSISTKQDAFDRLLALQASTDLVTVIMPEFSASNMNVTEVTVERSARGGADLLLPVVTLDEARVYARDTTVTRLNGRTSVADQGSVQAQTPSASQAATISAAGVY